MEKYEHLLNNLERISHNNSIFDYEYGRKALLSLSEGNRREWLEKLLPNTRLILEPRITGSKIGIQYINSKLNKAINKKSRDITEEVKAIKCVPKTIPIKKRIEIQGVLYNKQIKSDMGKKIKLIDTHKSLNVKKITNFCAFQIFHCKINQFQALKELKNLDFETPETQITKFISEIEMYRHCWKEGKLFQNYPTNGIVLKINSRKLQKHLGQNNLSIHWAYAIK